MPRFFVVVHIVKAELGQGLAREGVHLVFLPDRADLGPTSAAIGVTTLIVAGYHKFWDWFLIIACAMGRSWAWGRCQSWGWSWCRTRCRSGCRCRLSITTILIGWPRDYRSPLHQLDVDPRAHCDNSRTYHHFLHLTTFALFSAPFNCARLLFQAIIE